MRTTFLGAMFAMLSLTAFASFQIAEPGDSLGRTHTLIYSTNGGKFWLSTTLFPSEVSRLDTACSNLTNFTRFDFDIDGLHDNAVGLVGPSTTNAVFVAFGLSGRIVVSYINISSMVHGDVINDTAATGARDMKTDGTNLFILCAQTNASTPYNQIRKYRLSDFSLQATLVLTNLQNGRSLAYDGTNFFAASNFTPPWVAKANLALTSFSSTTLPSYLNTASDDIGVTPTNLWIGFEAAAANGSIALVKKSDLSVTMITNSAFGNSYGMFWDGRYMWDLKISNPGQYALIDPGNNNSVTVFTMPQGSNPNEWATDGNCYIVSLFVFPLLVARVDTAQSPSAPGSPTSPPVLALGLNTGTSATGTIVVQANTTSMVGVNRVEFYVDGTLASTDFVSPYQSIVNTTLLTNGPHLFMAKSYDNVGNSTASAASRVIVTNNVVPPPATNTPSTLLWVKTTLPPYLAQAWSVVTDGSGNVFATGYFMNVVDFGSGNVNSAGGDDAFIVKYSSTGVLQWVKRIGGPLTDRAKNIALDASGNIIITGTFQSTVNFGAATLSPYGGTQDTDVFVAKYDSTGSNIWALHYGSVGADGCNGMALDSAGNIVVSGISFGTVNFGNGISRTTHGANDLTLAKFSNANGTTLWGQMYGGSVQDLGRGAAIDANNDVLVCGAFGGSGNMGGGAIPGGPNSGTFIAKYAGATGAFIWARILAAPTCNAVAVDPVTTNVFLTGGISGATDLGGGTNVNSVFGAGGIFLSCYDRNGAYQWAKAYGGSGDAGFSLAFRGSDLAVNGTVQGPVDLVGQGNTVPGTGVFVGLFSPAGVVRWVKRANSTLSIGLGVYIDTLSPGHVLASGTFQGTVDFGGISGTTQSQGSFVNQYAK